MTEAAALLAALVAIPSINPAFHTPDDPPDWFGEAAMAHAVASWLAGHGIEVALDEVAPGRPNVIARVRGAGARRRLLWEGHLDTVQTTGMAAPFRPDLRNGRLHGRGAVDDKGCLAGFMLALRDLSKDPPPLDLTFVAAVDEEYQFRGITHHLARGEPADGGVAGEPTDLRIVSACKGCVRWEIEVRGRAAHSSRPHEGVDAIAIGSDLAVHLRNVFGARLATRSHPLLGRPTLVCTRIVGGEGYNTVPAGCRLTFDRRTLPNETGRQAWEECAAEVAAFATRVGGSAQIIMHEPFIDSISMEVADDAAIITASRASCRTAGLDETVMGVPFGSDASKMTRAGIPTIIFGPGSIEQAHSVDEYVELAQVEQAARMLGDMARRFAEP